VFADHPAKTAVPIASVALTMQCPSLVLLLITKPIRPIFWAGCQPHERLIGRLIPEMLYFRVKVAVCTLCVSI
jgi:hypothetical protein